MPIDIRSFVLCKEGPWADDPRLASCAAPHRLVLAAAGDGVTLEGPLALQVTRYEAAGEAPPQAVSSYTVTIPAGSRWSHAVSEQDLEPVGPHAEAEVFVSLEPLRTATDPLPPWQRRRPVAADCEPKELPCDFAAAEIPDTGVFFPSPCDPCPPGVPVGVPPTKKGLQVPPAPGGCVRPRFFDGMFITRQDLDTLVRWTRLKDQLHNRAAGQGVVWGLALERRESDLLVHPGYAVDCCGHDLTLNAVYCVPIGELLCDPAARAVLARPGPQCLHLLLEYFECPEEPRPVHGDPCSPDVDRCEMSRIRETVRLRLVPPRHHEPDGPIQDFLDEVGEVLGEPGSAAAPVRAEAAELGDEAPWSVEVTSGDAVVASLQPSRTAEVAASFVVSVGSLRLRPRPGEMLLGGRVTKGGETVAEVAVPSPVLEWAVELDDAGGGTQAAEYGIEDLLVGPQFPRPGESRFESKARMPVTFISGQRFSTVAVSPVEVQVIVSDEPVDCPCLADPCCPDRPLFPVTPPFLHQHPPGSGTAADLQVLVLAALHTWLALELSCERQDEGGIGGRGELARAIYLAAFAAFFEVEEEDDLLRLGDALHRLLCAWCRGLLYPGPRCDGEPHGAVIGCVRVERGEITRLDPWGGRRWMVRYPLLTYWGEQLGLAPLDLTASRTVAMLCCVANLPAPLGQAVPGFEAAGLAGTGAAVPFGDRVLIRRGAGDAAAAVPRGARIVGSEEVGGLAELLTRAVAGLREPPLPAGAPRLTVRAAGVPGIELLVPAAPAAPAAPPEPSPLARRIGEMAEKSRADVGPLLEGVARELTAAVLDLTPLAGLEDNPLAAALERAGMRSVGAFLARPLSEIHEEVTGRLDPRALLALDRANERTTLEVSRAVRAVVARIAGERDLVAAEEMRAPERAAELAEALVEEVERRRKLDVPEPALRAAVARALGGRRAPRR